MIRAHKIIRHWRTNDFHWKRSMASHSRRLAQNHVAAPLRWEEIESDYGPRLLLIARFPDYAEPLKSRDRTPDHGGCLLK